MYFKIIDVSQGVWIINNNNSYNFKQHILFSSKIVKPVINRINECFNLGFLILYTDTKKSNWPFDFSGIVIFLKYCLKVEIGLSKSVSVLWKTNFQIDLVLID